MIKEEPDDDIDIEDTFALQQTSQPSPPDIKLYCNVDGCIAQVDTPDCSLFPLPDETSRRSLWLKRLGLVDFNETKLGIHVCAKHFKKSDFSIESNCKKLNKDAIPSLFLPNKTICQDKSIQVKPLMYDNFSQTDNVKMSDVSVQVAFESSNDLKRKLSPELLECKKRLMVHVQASQSHKKKQFRQECDRFLSDQLAELIKCQTDLQLNSRGNRYPLPHKIFSMNLLFISPTVYQMLEKDFVLPSACILKKKDGPVSTEFSEEQVGALKLKVSNMSESEKFCAVVVDTMKLKANLYYNVVKDRIVGFHDIGGRQIPTPAMYAVVVLVRGILDDWMQPVTFSFVSEGEKPAGEISKWMDNVLEKLIETGLKIKAYIPSFKTDLLDEAKIREISEDKPYFLIHDTKIYYIFSVPEMMKYLRQCFLTNNFTFQKDNRVVKAMFKFVKELYKNDKSKPLPMAPKLNDDHLHRCKGYKKSVRLASQIFSNTVATALETYIDFGAIAPSARDTVQMLLLMNNLFDILNSTKHTDEPYKTAYSGSDAQEEILKTSLKLFQSLQVYHAKTGVVGSFGTEFIEGFQVTILAMADLLKELKLEGYDSFFAGRLNLNQTDNFFKAIRTKSDMTVVPISQHFIMCFRRAYFSHILKPVKGGYSCSKDLTQLLIGPNESSENNEDRNESSSSSGVKSTNCVDSSWIDLTTANFNEIPQSETNSVQEIGSFLLKKCISKHKKCVDLQNFSASFNSGDISALPSVKCFVEYILAMEKEFRKAFETLQQNPNVAVPVYERIIMLDFSPPCPCFPVMYFQKLFIKLRIHMSIQYNNTIYRKRKHIGISFIVPKITNIKSDDHLLFLA